MSEEVASEEVASEEVEALTRNIVVVEDTSKVLPFKANNPPELTEVENKTLDSIPEAMPMDVTIVVDVSYSMGQGCDGLNMAYKPLKKYIESLAQGSYLKIITFSNDYKISFDLAAKNSLDLDTQLRDMLRPRGGTAFRDAMIQTINDIKNKPPNEDERKHKHLLFVITDGLDYDSSHSLDDLNAVTIDAWSESSSGSVGSCHISDVMDGKGKKKGIDCLFMHPPQLNGPEILQLSPNSCLTYIPDDTYTAAAIASIQQVSYHYSHGNVLEITNEMRLSSCPVITNEMRQTI